MFRHHSLGPSPVTALWTSCRTICGGPHRRQRHMVFVGADSPRHAEQVRDVFRSSARGAWSCESSVTQSGEGPIPVLAREEGGRRRFQRWVTVGVSSQGGSGEKLFGPREILVFLEGEHLRDKSSDGLAVCADGGYSKSSVSSRQGIRLGVALLPLARRRSSKRQSSPRVRRLAILVAVPSPGGTEANRRLRAPLLQ